MNLKVQTLESRPRLKLLPSVSLPLSLVLRALLMSTVRIETEIEADWHKGQEGVNAEKR